MTSPTSLPALHAASRHSSLKLPRCRPLLWALSLCGHPHLRRFSASPTCRTKPYYITTPIFYVNAAPHVGHLYSMVLADILKRWQQLRGRPALLSTGTDEHGMKVQRAAERAKTEPKLFCDEGAEVFKSLAAKANVSNDHFVRTTDADHKEAVQYAWTVLKEKDYIYLSKHEGWYSVSDETFYPPSAVHLIVDPPTGRKIMVSMETGKEVEWTSETNYRFRLSAFRDDLLKLYNNNPRFVVPAARMKDVVQAVTEGLEDLSVSRPSSRLTWGVPVPDDSSQTIYVWLDALINYATKAGYPWTPGRESEKGWPADCHVIGKDIVRFHCIYWPAFLFALGAAPPKQILSHAHWTLGREKMAKSTGNVVNPFFAIDRFGTDAMRYYLAHDGGIASDSDYDNEYIIAKYKKGLQGGLGNLTSRVLRGKGWSVPQAVQNNHSTEASSWTDEASRVQYEMLQQTPDKVAAKFDLLDSGAALREIMDMIYGTNGYMQHMEPWELCKHPTEQARLEQCIFLCSEAIRLAAILLQPFMPSKMAQLAEMLGLDAQRRSYDFAKVGADSSYGTSRVKLGKGLQGTLFPPLLSDA